MRKIRLGFYMYTPMVGGAETYLKDLLWNMDRERFDLIFFYEAWPDFEEFLRLDQCPAIQLQPVSVIEPGGHTHVNQNKEPAQNSERNKNGHVNLKTRLRPLHKRIPFGPSIATNGLRWLNYSLWSANKKKLTAAFSEQSLDVLHIVNGGYPGATTATIAAVVARELGIPCVMTISGTPQRRRFPQSVERRIDDLIFQSVDKFIIISDLMGRQLSGLRDFHPTKFHKIYWGVEVPERIGNDDQMVRKKRADFGIPEDALIIGSVSRFTPGKGQAYLIDAVSHLRSRVPGLRLVLVGDGPTQLEMKTRVMEKGLGDVTTFTGQYDNKEVFEVLRTFDLFVHASEREGLPYVVLEALSQRKPIVATDVGGTSEAIISGKTGLLVPPRDPVALAKAIGSIIDDPEMAEEMGNRAHTHFVENFTIERMLKQHELLYRQVAESKMRPMNEDTEEQIQRPSAI